MISRVTKQLTIGGIYILIAVVIVGGIYWSNYRPTCLDGIQNGKEEGVDCGTLACSKACIAAAQPLVIQDTQLIKTPAGDFDLAVLVYNPNTEYGADAVGYDLVISDTSGAEILRRSSSFYILPGQTRYVVQTSLQGIPDGASAKVVIKNADWVKTPNSQEVYFITGRETLTPSTKQTTYETVITNNSNFDFDTVDVSMVVRNNAGDIIATNMTNLQSVFSHTDRSIKVTWPFALPVDARVQTEVGTNVFNNANFLKRNGTQEKFQQYY